MSEFQAERLRLDGDGGGGAAMWAEIVALAKEGEGVVNLVQGAPDFTGISLSLCLSVCV
jgi:hypothetical protein